MNSVKLKKIMSLFLAIAVLSTSIAFSCPQNVFAAAPPAKTWNKVGTTEYQTKWYKDGTNIVINAASIFAPALLGAGKAVSIIVGCSAWGATTINQGNTYVVVTQFIYGKAKDANSSSKIRVVRVFYADKAHKTRLGSSSYYTTLGDLLRNPGI